MRGEQQIVCDEEESIDSMRQLPKGFCEFQQDEMVRLTCTHRERESFAFQRTRIDNDIDVNLNWMDGWMDGWMDVARKTKLKTK